MTPFALRALRSAWLPALALLLVASRSSAQDAKPLLELKKGDHICVIGNTLADRMQHDGWLETYIQARFPKHELVFRDLGFSGDEIAQRIRSQWFGSPDEWLAGKAPVPNLAPNALVSRIGVRENRFELTNTKADVIFAFFGYNESWAGEAGLDKFKKDLDTWIKHTLSQKYNGKSAPKLVLCSPTAFEDHKSPNLPDGKDINKRLEMYTKAMGEAAKANGILFVDLFAFTSRTNKQAQLTINGVHLSEYGNQLVASFADHTLFGQPGVREEKLIAKLREAVQDKNFYWFNRYRVMDGYNVYGGRAFEKYADRQSNYEDQQRELEIFDVKTSNRDKRIWAVAQGGDMKVDDSNCPPLIPVKTNRPHFLPENGFKFIDGEEAIKNMTIAKGLKVQLFASEKEFPDLLNKPVQMQFDAKGRLWVAVWPSYPRWKPTEERRDKLVIFEDTNGDGKADKTTVFADNLNCPTGFDFWNGGVLIAQAPDLWFLKDTDGDGKADVRERVIHGLCSADSHHTSNSFVFDQGGSVYFQEGTFHATQVEDPYGPTKRCSNGGVFRYEPRTQKFEVYVTTGFANPHGHVFDKWGQDIVVDGTGSQPYHAVMFSGRLNYPDKHPKPPQVYQQRVRPCPGMEYLSSDHFPPEWQGNLLVADVIQLQGILRYRIDDKGASFGGTEQEVLVTSKDPTFRPSDLKVAPDGSLYFLDWSNPIIGHLQHAIRDPARDRTHGRIYRMTYEGRPLSKPTKIDGEPIAKLLDLLKHHEDRVRYRVRNELTGRKTDEVIAALNTWVKTVASEKKDDPNRVHHLLEGLWLYQSHNVVNTELLNDLLNCDDFRARAAAVRVLTYWRDRVPDALEILKKKAADQHPRVRMQAVWGASFFTSPEAIEVPIVANDFSKDIYIDFTMRETMRVLQPQYQTALTRGDKVNFTTNAGSRFMLRTVELPQLLKMQRTRPVCLELLYRPGVTEADRRIALRDLAKLEKQTELKVLLGAISHLDDVSAGSGDLAGRDESIVFDLVRLLSGRQASELTTVRADLERLALEAKKPLLRQVGFVALTNVDGTPDKVWDMASKSVNGLRDLLSSVSLMTDATVKLGLYSKMEPLLEGLPAPLAEKFGKTKGISGRYVRIDLKGKKTLSLAEVQVFSNGVNVALKKKATQINVGAGGGPERAVDGNTAGIFAMGSITHTIENSANPWWEVDLGEEFPIDQIVVWNRTEMDLGNRLNNFNLYVLDRQRNEVFKQQNNSAPPRKAEFELGGSGPTSLIRRATMEAMTSVRGQEAKTFLTLTKYIQNDTDRFAAIHAALRLPRDSWSKDSAPKLTEVVLTAIKKIPTAERTGAQAVDALEFADGLAALLPSDDAKKLRVEIGELGVRVIRIHTLPERMAYDKEIIAVRAGKPVEFVFENTDFMPHNFVIVNPGTLATVGKLGEDTAKDADAAARQFVPKSANVLLYSNLLQPREVQKLSFMVPKEPGIYPYVCTFPGHWMRMYGALYVVADLEAYQADAEAYLAKNPLPIKDDLLKFNRPRKEWKFEELAGEVEKLEHRSFTNGKQMFRIGSCIGCHKFGGEGVELGPDLAKLEMKIDNPKDILLHILEPSKKIDEKFQTWRIETDAGKKITGMILEDKNGVIKIIENPLQKADPVVVKAADILKKEKVMTSIMPKGAIDKFTKEEILDLIAYIASKADAKHKYYQDGHGH